jgi:TPR repeat protein
MNSCDSVVSVQIKPPFHEAFRKIQEEAETVLYLPGREKASQLADRFFNYLQANLASFDGADPDLSALIDRLEPFKSEQLRIEPLLKKIIQDLRAQNQRLVDISRKKIVPFSSSLAAFPLPLVDTTRECAELTSQFLRKEKEDFSLPEMFGMCCLLVAQNMKPKATLLFQFHVIRHFVKDPQEFTQQVLGYEGEARWILHPTAIQNNISILKDLLKDSIDQSCNLDLLSKISPDLFEWLQSGGPGEKERFQGHEQIAYGDYTKAFEYYRQAADLGNSQALVAMGNLYSSGKGLPAQDYAKAFDCYKQAADLGNSKALIKIGNCYRTGKGVPSQDHAKAFEYYKQAADLGNSEALVEIGDCYWFSKSVPAQDYAKAFEHYKQAADLGNIIALIKIGTSYWTGKGVPAQDYAKAFEYYKQAADLGNSQALAEMGDCYWSGKGVPVQDYAKAFEYYKQAADLGNSRALVEMGACYWSGKGVPHNDKEAFECWLKAKKLNHDRGALNVAQCLTLGRGTPRNLEEAKAILLDLISRNVPDANAFYIANFSN